MGLKGGKVVDPNKEGRNKFVPKKRDLRVTEILQDIVAGLNKTEIITKYRKEWNCSENFVRDIITEAYVLINDEEYVKQARNINLMRLNDIYAEAVEQGNLNTQLKAVDLISKTAGVYADNEHQVNIQINNSDKTFEIKFQGD